MIREINEIIAKKDPEVAAAIAAEYDRENNGIELIASENFVSEEVMLAAGCIMTNKYAEGYPSKRYYGGCHVVDVAENLARERACKLFGAEHANVQPHSGSQANTAVYFALCNPGDTIMGMSLAHGGHLTHGSPVNLSGKYFNFVSYGLTDDDEVIDYDAIEKAAKEFSVCPYELSLDLSELCDIIICDYNYAFDPAVYLRRYFAEGVNAGKSVFLIDEAHNLPDRVRDMYSCRISRKDFETLYAATGKTEPELDSALEKIILFLTHNKSFLLN